MNPDISILINCRNGEAYLRETLESVVKQTYTNWEVVFVDNQSTDESANIAKQYPKLSYHMTPEPLSLGAARNFGLSKCHGDFIAFLDADDLWEPKKLSEQIALFNDLDVALVYTDTKSFNNAGDSKVLSESKRFPAGNAFGPLFVDYCLCMSSVMIRSSTLQSLPIKFNDKFNMIEEADLFLRIAYFNKVDFCPEVLTRWRVHSDSLTWTKFHLLAEETKEMIASFKEEFPDFRVDYQDQIDLKEKWIKRNEVLGYWIAGNGEAARSTVLKTRNMSLKLIAIYVLTIFPAKLLLPILSRFFGSVVTPS